MSENIDQIVAAVRTALEGGETFNANFRRELREVTKPGDYCPRHAPGKGMTITIEIDGGAHPEPLVGEALDRKAWEVLARSVKPRPCPWCGKPNGTADRHRLCEKCIAENKDTSGWTPQTPPTDSDDIIVAGATRKETEP